MTKNESDIIDDSVLSKESSDVNVNIWPSKLGQCISIPVKLSSGEVAYIVAPQIPATGEEADNNGEVFAGNLDEEFRSDVEYEGKVFTKVIFLNESSSSPHIPLPDDITSVEAVTQPVQDNLESTDITNEPSKCTLVVKMPQKHFMKSQSQPGPVQSDENVHCNPTSLQTSQVDHDETDAMPSKCPGKKRGGKKVNELAGVNGLKLEEDVEEVRARFDQGCECPGDSCFEGLNPEFVYKHRLNIAELTRAEHDMYLMGVTMATATNPQGTTKANKRQRFKTSYNFLGKEVCLDAWLYLENCTLYQLRCVRKHLLTHGVSPRVHGNQGKRPHNTFSLSSYQLAFNFLDGWFKDFTKRVCALSESKSRRGSKQHQASIQLPPEVTRKKLHRDYKKYLELHCPSDVRDESGDSLKPMGYFTFCQFIKARFPHVRFAKFELNSPKFGTQQGVAASQVSSPVTTTVSSDVGIVSVDNSDDNQSSSQITVDVEQLNPDTGRHYLLSVPVVACETVKNEDTRLVYFTFHND